MYKISVPKKSLVSNVELFEGERLEDKIKRITEDKEPIKDGAPEIFTARKDGVLAAYNIRTDRFEIAADAMDAVHKSKIASREARMNIVKDDVKDGGPDGESKGDSSVGGA